MTMRSRFYRLAAEALEDDERVAVVLAAIGASEIPAHPRLFDVGIREQLMIGVSSGLALEGYRPVVHTFAPFLVERPYEQVKLDLGHQGVGALLVSAGASYDGAHYGATHMAPGDVAALSALPGWTIHVPGHPDEMERLFRAALATDDRVYLRLTDEENHARVDGTGIVVLRRGSDDAPLVLAVGPTLAPALKATVDLDVTVAYLMTVRPFDREGLRAALTGTDVVLIEPYLAGTSASEISAALSERPHRLLSLGTLKQDLRRYGTGAEHRAAHGLDAAGIRRSIDRWRVAYGLVA
jgi:transketolase